MIVIKAKLNKLTEYARWMEVLLLAVLTL